MNSAKKNPAAPLQHEHQHSEAHARFRPRSCHESLHLEVCTCPGRAEASISRLRAVLHLSRRRCPRLRSQGSDDQMKRRLNRLTSGNILLGRRGQCADPTLALAAAAAAAAGFEAHTTLRFTSACAARSRGGRSWLHDNVTLLSHCRTSLSRGGRAQRLAVLGGRRSVFLAEASRRSHLVATVSWLALRAGVGLGGALRPAGPAG